MDIQKVIDDLEMIERTIPDYSEGRRRGLTDVESEITASVAIGKAVEALEGLQNQIEVLSDTVNILSPMMMENKNMKTYIRNGVELGYIDDKEGDYKKYLQKEDE